MCDVWADQNDATLDGYNGKARRTDGAFPTKKGPPTMNDKLKHRFKSDFGPIIIGCSM